LTGDVNNNIENQGSASMSNILRVTILRCVVATVVNTFNGEKT